MSDYSDLIYLMAAMIIYSILALNAAHYFRINEQFQYQSEIQYNAIAVAQDVIDEIRWINDINKFDENSGQFIGDDYPKTIEFSVGNNEYSLDYEVDIIVSDTNVTGSNAVNKLVKIIVTNEYLPENQRTQMNYVKSFVN